MKRGSDETSKFETVNIPTIEYFESFKESLIEAIHQSQNLQKPQKKRRKERETEQTERDEFENSKRVLERKLQEFEEEKSAFRVQKRKLDEKEAQLVKELSWYRSKRREMELTVKESPQVLDEEDDDEDTLPVDEEEEEVSLKEKLASKFAITAKKDEVYLSDEDSQPVFCSPYSSGGAKLRYNELPETLAINDEEEDSSDVATQKALSEEY